MPQFLLDPRITQQYPDLLVGLLVCNGVRNGPSPLELVRQLREEERRVRQLFPDPETIKAHPVIAAWQEIHRSFGSNPNKFPSSIHALLKRIAKGGELPSINALVDAYNVVSLRHILPAGGEDLDACEGDIALTVADGSEAFVPLGSSANESPEPTEVIYRDALGAICRKFNWREAARTSLTERTHNAVLVVEAVTPVLAEHLEQALMDLQSLVSSFCGGSQTTYVLSASSPAAPLS